MGTLNFNVAKFSGIDGPSIQNNLMTTLHEVTHGLGFTKTNFQNFIDENGNKRKDPVISFTAANG